MKLNQRHKHQNGIERREIKNGNELPKILHRYSDSDFITKQKAKFVLYLSAVLIITMFFLIITTSYIQILNPIYGKPYLPVIGPQIVVLLVFILCLFVLLRGHYNLSANLMLISAIAAVWMVVWFDKSGALGRLDTLSFIFASLTMAPLLIGKRSLYIFLYTFINICFVIGFVIYFKDTLEISTPTIRSYLLDVCTSLFFVGFVGYSIFRINKKALERAEEDIRERNEAEKALAKNEKKYREMADLLPQAVFEADIDGKLTYVNKSGFQLFGYSPDDLIEGVNIFKSLAHEDHEAALKNIKGVLGENPAKAFEYTAIRKDGSRFPVNIYSNAVRESGKIIGIRGTIVDITEQKKSEEAIRRSEELFRSVIEFMPTAVALTDIEGRYILVNKAFTYDTGFEFSELEGKKSEEIGLSIDTKILKEIFLKLSTIGVVENVEMKLLNKSGVYLYFYFSARVIQLKDQPAILASAINITEKKKIDVELENYHDHLEELVIERTNELYAQQVELEKTINELRGTQKQLIQTEKMASLGILASGVAHEINNPLNFISGGIYGIENYIKNIIPEHAEKIAPLIDAVNTGVKRSSEIVKSLNRFSRQNPNLSEECDIHSIINDCLIILYNKIKDRITITKQFSEHTAVVIGNEGKLHQAFLNILTNSIQSIDNKGSITIETRFSDSYITIAIEDNGVGIEPQNLEHIFDAFFTTKLPGTGTGLGLTITYDIIKEMKGMIEIQSKPGKGTKAIVQLPLAN
jgi:PAS domain S-box-containing protein